METLETLKLMLSINDDSKDTLLTQIIKLCEAPVLSYIGENIIPVALNWIIIEMAIIRYNKLKSEGIKSESIDGSSVSFVDNAFDLYKGDLDTYISNKNRNKKGATFY